MRTFSHQTVNTLAVAKFWRQLLNVIAGGEFNDRLGEFTVHICQEEVGVSAIRLTFIFILRPSRILQY